MISEFSENNETTIDDICFIKSNKYLWVCHKCNSEYDMRISDRVNKNSNCPYCSGRRVNINNCIATTNPEVSMMFEDKDLTLKVTEFSSKRANFVCSECNYISENKIISQITRQGLQCPKCYDGRSFAEKLMINLLELFNLDFESQKKFLWSDNWYDFYIPSLNMIIEIHGRQHFEENCYEKVSGKTLTMQKETDRIKKELATSNGIDIYIEIDCSSRRLDFLKNNIIESEMKNYFNFLSVDWELIYNASKKSLIRKVCDLWNQGIKDTKELVKITHLGRTTIVNYLHRGNKLGFCNYNPYETRSKPVLQLNISGEIIKEFKSTSEASKATGIFESQINMVCNGKGFTAGGYKWLRK